MTLWRYNSRRGLTKLTNRCPSASTQKKRTSMEKGRNHIKKVIEEDEESADYIYVERGKNNG